MKQDLRFALRLLIKSPGFTSIAVIALALGIGANTAIFSVVNAVLLRPLSYSQPERLAMIWQHLANTPNFGRVGGCAQDALDYRDQARTMQTVGAFVGRSYNFTGRGTPERVDGVRVSVNLFAMLGVAPLKGRTFTPDEDQPGRNQEIVLSYGSWQRRFGSDPNVLGATVFLDQAAYKIVGVMPNGFEFPPQGLEGPVPGEFWTPIAFTPEQLAARGDSFGIYMIGRLKPGVTMAQANGDVAQIAQRITETYPAQFRERRRTTASVEDLHEQITGRIRISLLVILGAVGFVLLIGCANVANLLLAKAASRQREIAVRAAIGASRWRILRQLLTESVLLSTAGGALGVILGVWTTDLLVRYGPDNVPRLGDARFDWRVLCFTLALSLLTGILFGVAPALHASRTNLGATLKEGGRGASGSLRRSRLRSGLVVGEVALALTLLIGAGLLLRSFLNLSGVPTGFRPDRVLTAAITVPTARYPDNARIQAFYGELVRRVRNLPSVQSAALGTALPFAGEWTIAIAPEGEPANIKSAFKTADLHGITSDYHRTLGIELKRGRLFTADDRANSLPVAIVNETTAQRYFAGIDQALGKRFKWGAAQSDRPWMQIVGIVADVKHSSLDERNRPTVYMPYSQMPTGSVERTGRNVHLALRTAADPSSVVSGLRSLVSSLDAELPIFAVRDMNSLLSATVAPRRFNMFLLTAFACLALLLAAVGIYGVMSYSVHQYTHEIGIRMALGATAKSVVGMVLRQGMTLALAGVAIGVGAAFALTRIMKSLLFGVSPVDPSTFIAVSLLLAAIAFLATYLPARRATQVDPIEALRYE